MVCDGETFLVGSAGIQDCSELVSPPGAGPTIGLRADKESLLLEV